MSIPIKIAKIGWGTDPVELVEWRAGEGGRVENDSVILAVTTKKIESDIHAEGDGYLHIVVPEGLKAEIGSVVGYIAETEEELKKIQGENPTDSGVTVEKEEDSIDETSVPEAVSRRSRKGEGIRISPVARKMAEENNIDISSITGTGPGGRIVRKDIENAIEDSKKPGVSSNMQPGKNVKSTIPLRGMRKAIAENMYQSISSSAQLTLMGEIDMTEVVKLRETLKAQFVDSITFTDIFVFVVAKALKEHPIINSSLEDNEIKIWENINIGIATAVDEGLIVPVVKDADKKPLSLISREIKALAGKAREGKLDFEDIEYGTFTITNMGALGEGYRFETVIINGHECAILGTGGISDRVVARDGEIVIRPVMTFYFTYDHRIITGAVAGAFTETVRKLLENPYLLIISKEDI